VQRSLVGSALYSDVNGLARRSLSGTGGGLVGVARRLLLTGSDTLDDLVDAARYLLLTGSDPVDALSHRVERHCVEVLGGWRGQVDHAGNVPRNW